MFLIDLIEFIVKEIKNNVFLRKVISMELGWWYYIVILLFDWISMFLIHLHPFAEKGAKSSLTIPFFTTSEDFCGRGPKGSEWDPRRLGPMGSLDHL